MVRKRPDASSALGARVFVDMPRGGKVGAILFAINRELITRMEARIQAVMDRVWGKSAENSG